MTEAIDPGEVRFLKVAVITRPGVGQVCNTHLCFGESPIFWGDRLCIICLWYPPL